jgi:peptidoglycan hydrolase-like protein with peptidoglycan-binding domain
MLPIEQEGGIDMRVLQLQTSNLTGPDVSDWQTFLKSRGLLSAAADGVFGPDTDAATRAYQTGAGLKPDGVVGQNTMSKAVGDGYQSTTRANLAGMDSNTNCSPFADRLSGQGMQFVARYYSNSAAKTLTAAEAQKLSAAGVGIVAVFENSNDSADYFSAEIGSSQAATALELAAAIGQPAGSAIYFAVDYDATPADVQGPITGYFTAINTALAAAATQYAIGVYGSGMTCRVVRDASLAKFTWLTCSIGFSEYAAFRSQADIVQLAPERALLAGLNIDDDIAQSAEFGAFRLAQALPAIIT